MRGRIEGVTPGATYQGDVYTQYVLVEFDDGVVLKLEDNRMLVSEEMVGAEADVKVSATLIDVVERVDGDADFEIEPYPDEKGPGIALLVSRVDSIDDDRIEIELFDGTLTSDTFDPENPLEPGDVVRCTDVTGLLLDEISTL